MTSLLSFLKRLWPWGRPRRPTARPPLDFAGPEVPVPEAPPPEANLVEVVSVEAVTVEPEAVAEPPQPAREQTGEAAADDEEPEEDEDAHDPDEEVFVDDEDALVEALSPARLAVERDLADALKLRRAEALAEALTGEHRIFLSDPTGPGSLAEALNILVQQGRVTAKFEEDEQSGAFILYRPVVEG